MTQLVKFIREICSEEGISFEDFQNWTKKLKMGASTHLKVIENDIVERFKYFGK